MDNDWSQDIESVLENIRQNGVILFVSNNLIIL